MLFLPGLLPDMIWISGGVGGPWWTSYVFFSLKNNSLMVFDGLWWMLLDILDLLAHLFDQHFQFHRGGGGFRVHGF